MEILNHYAGMLNYAVALDAWLDLEPLFELGGLERSPYEDVVLTAFDRSLRALSSAEERFQCAWSKAMFLMDAGRLPEAISLLGPLRGKYPQISAFNTAGREQVLGLINSNIALAYARLGELEKTKGFEGRLSSTRGRTGCIFSPLITNWPLLWPRGEGMKKARVF